MSVDLKHGLRHSENHSKMALFLQQRLRSALPGKPSKAYVSLYPQTDGIPVLRTIVFGHLQS